jgi:hypothetical protein
MTLIQAIQMYGFSSRRRWCFVSASSISWL